MRPVTFARKPPRTVPLCGDVLPGGRQPLVVDTGVGVLPWHEHARIRKLHGLVDAFVCEFAYPTRTTHLSAICGFQRHSDRNPQAESREHRCFAVNQTGNDDGEAGFRGRDVPRCSPVPAQGPAANEAEGCASRSRPDPKAADAFSPFRQTLLGGIAVKSHLPAVSRARGDLLAHAEPGQVLPFRRMQSAAFGVSRTFSGASRVEKRGTVAALSQQ